MSNETLFFAYDAALDPDRMEKACPGARFLFTAHYPETRLAFVVSDSSEPRATLIRESGHTVWGGVFSIPEGEVESLVDQLGNGREVSFEQKAVDREGNKHDCMTFVAPTNGDTDRPGKDYVGSMIRGARHWSLPAGWVLGLEDLAE